MFWTTETPHDGGPHGETAHPFELFFMEKVPIPGEMVRIDEESANELFNTLADWNAQLEARAASLPDEPEPPEPH
ncbi:MAG: hypothetical protein ABJP66_12315 [Hyphomicrobiales bacterium]